METSRWCSEQGERNHRNHADSGLAPEGRRIRATVRAAPAGAGGAIAGDHSAPGDAAAAAESEER